MSQDELPNLRPALQAMRIVVFALVMGAVVFAAVALYVVHGMNGPVAPMNDLLSIIMAVFAAILLVVQFIGPPMIFAAQRNRLIRQSPLAYDYGLLALYRSQFIIKLALCEAAAFAVLQAYLLEGAMWLLPIAAFAILLMMAQFPSLDGLTIWLQQQRDGMVEEQLTDRGSA